MSSPIDPVKLDKLAELAIKVGLGLKEGQDLFMTSPTSALPLARKITEHAYKAGAGLVTTIFSDEEMTLARYRYGHDLSFDRAPAGSTRALPRRSTRTRRASPFRATIRCCSARKIPTRSAAPTAPIPRPTGPH